MKEKDVEYAFADWLNDRKNYSVIAHQVRLPLGKLDILAMVQDGTGVYPAVAEIKLGRINEKACTQLLGYMEQVERIMADNTQIEDENWRNIRPLTCVGILVGTSLNPMCARVVQMAKMHFVQYDVRGGRCIFNWPRIDGTTPTDQFKLTGPLKALVTLRERLKAYRVVRNAQALGSEENYSAIMDGESRPWPGETLADTLPFWRRERK
jgi:hypothetical protein